ncbi:MAG: hypothetical protein M3P47_01260, partial [Pseudomonadota bacterium]|nr:hypothetical protein [Pseudomonadota bacterium]
TYHNNYKGAPTNGSAWVQKTSGNDRSVGRVIRGGSWKYTSNLNPRLLIKGGKLFVSNQRLVGYRVRRINAEW